MERIDPNHISELLRAEHFHRYVWAGGLARGYVCDVACGIGYGSRFLLASKNVRCYLGIDFSPQALRTGLDRFRRPEADFLAGDAYHVPLANESVDTVVSLETLEHLDVPELALTEFVRILKPGGILIGSVPALAYEQACEDVYGPNIYHKSRIAIEDLRAILQKSFRRINFFHSSLEIVSRLQAEAESADGKLLLEEAGAWPVVMGSILFVCSNSDEIETLSGDGAAATRIYPAQSLIEHDRELLQPRTAVMQAQTQMIDERDALIRAQDNMVRGRDETILNQGLLIDERDDALVMQAQMIDDKDAALAAQARLIDEKDKALEAQTWLIEARDEIIRNQDEIVRGRDEALAAQARMIDEKDKALAAQVQMIDERDSLIRRQDEIVWEHEDALAAQARMIDERDALIRRQDEIVREHDEALAAQARMIDERDALIRLHNDPVRERDEALAAQARMIEERDALIRQQDEIVRDRDRSVAALTAELDQSKLTIARCNELIAEIQKINKQFGEKCATRERSLDEQAQEIETLRRQNEQGKLDNAGLAERLERMGGEKAALESELQNQRGELSSPIYCFKLMIKSIFKY